MNQINTTGGYVVLNPTRKDTHLLCIYNTESNATAGTELTQKNLIAIQKMIGDAIRPQGTSEQPAPTPLEVRLCCCNNCHTVQAVKVNTTRRDGRVERPFNCQCGGSGWTQIKVVD